MKRYRILNLAIDSTRSFFKSTTGDQMLEQYKEQMRDSIVFKYGEFQFEEKFKRYMELKKPVLTIVGEFSYLLEDISNSYISGNLYSAITGACCLGERIFNDIIFRIAPYHKSSHHYKEVYKRGSFNDWPIAIRILKNWGVLDKETEAKYLALGKIRNDIVHYQKKDQDLEVMCLEAINLINSIIEKLFGLFRKDILLVFDVPGELFIRKDAESSPLVKEFYIPCAAYVGYGYSIVPNDTPPPINKLVDDHEYEEKEISDEEFVRLRKEFTGKAST